MKIRTLQIIKKILLFLLAGIIVVLTALLNFSYFEWSEVPDILADVIVVSLVLLCVGALFLPDIVLLYREKRKKEDV